MNIIINAIDIYLELENIFVDQNRVELNIWIKHFYKIYNIFSEHKILLTKFLN